MTAGTCWRRGCELRVLRYLPTNLSRPEIASQPCNAHENYDSCRPAAPASTTITRSCTGRVLGPWVMVECRQVNQHHQDLVIVVLAGAAGRQEP